MLPFRAEIVNMQLQQSTYTHLLMSANHTYDHHKHPLKQAI